MKTESVFRGAGINGETLKPLFITDEGEVVLEGFIDCDGPVREGDVISLSDVFTEKDISVIITGDTEVCLGPSDIGRIKVDVLVAVRRNRCEAVMICPALFDASFGAFEEAVEKYRIINWFIKLSASQRQSIVSQLRGGTKHKRAKLAHSDKIKSYENLKKKYMLTKELYSPQQQADIEEMLEELKKPKSGTVKEKAERRLTYLLNINTSDKTSCNLTKSEIVSLLDKEMYKLDAVKDKIAETIVSSGYTASQGTAILLVGDPGVGKTAISEAIADVLGLPYGRIPLGSASTLLDLIGLCYTYDGSDCGKIIRTFYDYGTTNIVLTLDEFDKTTVSKEGNPMNAFNDILSDAHTFTDAFLSSCVDTSNTIIIATANSTDNIPENLLDRFTIIKIEPYTHGEKMEIVQSFIVPKCLSSFGIEPGLIRFTKTAVRHILDNYCEDAGVRDAKCAVEDIVRRIVCDWDEAGVRTKTTVTVKLIDSVLDARVDPNSDSIRYLRNKALYSPDVDKEIRIQLDKLRRTDLDGGEREKARKKLHYLTTLIPVGSAFTSFDTERFLRIVNKSHFGLENVKRELAEIFYSASVRRRPLSSVRLLLVGDPGIGKTSLIKAVAKALNAPYEKISLNGVSDESALKGHSETYIGADAGLFVKRASRMGTTKGILHLDEIDKLGSREGKSVANTLIDLLDDSAEMTDIFLSVPVDFSHTMFIATANDLGAVPQLIRDRFTIVNIGGYSAEEKLRIAVDHILPELESSLCPAGTRICPEPDMLPFLIDNYCYSTGVRDLKKALESIVRHKLFTMEGETVDSLVLTTDDVTEKLGALPIPRGNYPSDNHPGLAKGLAVTGDHQGMAFAVETAVLPTEDVIITGLPKASAADSVKIAHSYLLMNYCGAVSGKGYHLHFGEGAVEKDGPSAGVAVTMSMLSAFLDRPITENCAYTGEIDVFGNVFAVGGTEAKVQAAIRSGCTKVFVPYDNYIRSDKLRSLGCDSVSVIPVKRLSEVIDTVFPEAE